MGMIPGNRLFGFKTFYPRIPTPLRFVNYQSGTGILVIADELQVSHRCDGKTRLVDQFQSTIVQANDYVAP